MMKKVLFTMVVVAMFFGLATSTASAQTVAELQALIAQLMAQLAALQAQQQPVNCNEVLTRDLTLGSRGTDVVKLQEFLIRNEYLQGGSSTGLFGPATRVAVIAFQRANGIPATGYVGPLTRSIINAAFCGSSVPPTPTSSPVEDSYRHSTVTCYDGYSIELGDPTSCKPSSLWRSYANESCKGHCANGKCGVSSFSVSDLCPSDPIPTPVPGTPVISGISGPTFLGVGEQGTWTVNASEPSNGMLNYAVIWGDNSQRHLTTMGESGIPQKENFNQSASFTHVYNRSGKFVPQFFVRSASGSFAQTSISVNVGNTSCVQEGGTVTGPVNPQNATYCCKGLTPVYPTGGRVGASGICRRMGNVGVQNVTLESQLVRSVSDDSPMLQFTARGKLISVDGDAYVYKSGMDISILNTTGKGGLPSVGVTRASIVSAPVVTDRMGNQLYKLSEDVAYQFTLSVMLDTSNMFSGAYYGQLDNVSYYNNLEDMTDGIAPINQPLDPIKSSAILIVGEQGPYITSVVPTPNAGNDSSYTINGERLKGSVHIIDNQGNEAYVSNTSFMGSRITLQAKLNPGYYNVYVLNPAFGRSNTFGLTVEGNQGSVAELRALITQLTSQINQACPGQTVPVVPTNASVATLQSIISDLTRIIASCQDQSGPSVSVTSFGPGDKLSLDGTVYEALYRFRPGNYSSYPQAHISLVREGTTERCYIGSQSSSIGAIRFSLNALNCGTQGRSVTPGRYTLEVVVDTNPAITAKSPLLEVVSFANPSVSITNPTAGTTVGRTFTAAGQCSNYTGNVSVYYYSSSRVTKQVPCVNGSWSTSITLTTNAASGSFDLYAALSSGQETRVKLPFNMSLQQPSITLVSPNGGETWNEGESKNIVFTYGGPLETRHGNYIEVLLGNQNGRKCTIKSGALSANVTVRVPRIGTSECLELPGPISGTGLYKLYVIVHGDDGILVSDESNNYFTIRGQVVTPTPNPTPFPTASPASITAPSDLSGKVGVRYDKLFTASSLAYPNWTNSTNVPGLTFAKELTPGLMTNYRLSGSPTQAGTYNVTLTASEVNGRTATKNVSIAVAPAATPTLTPAANPVSINIPSDMSGKVGTSYSKTFSGAIDYFTWSYSGNLPPGLTFSTRFQGISVTAADLKGTPTQSGTYTFNVTMREVAGSNRSDTKTVTVTISPADVSKTITVTSPRNGANWTLGSNATINWVSTGFTGTEGVTITGEMSNGAKGVVGSPNVGAGTYTWPLQSGSYSDTVTVKVCVGVTCGSTVVNIFPDIQTNGPLPLSSNQPSLMELGTILKYLQANLNSLAR